MKNYSRQREEIIKVIEKSYDHLTAEDIYMTVKAKDPAVSRSTVYRNLNLLVDSGIVNKISMQIGPDRFDYVRNLHNHAICIKCGKIMDFDYSFEYDKIKEIVKKQTGIEISTSTGIAIEGLCDSCKNN